MSFYVIEIQTYNHSDPFEESSRPHKILNSVKIKAGRQCSGYGLDKHSLAVICIDMIYSTDVSPLGKFLSKWEKRRD